MAKPLQLVDAGRRPEIEAYLDASIPHLERAVIDVLASVVDAMNAASPEVAARLELDGRGFAVSFEAQADAEPELTFDDADIERITLRLPKGLKELIDIDAERHGISANQWYVHHLHRLLARDLRHAGARGVTGRRPDGDDDRGQRGYRGRGPYRGRPIGDRG
jgi:predicted HicB family RNase H-like nuclease